MAAAETTNYDKLFQSIFNNKPDAIKSFFLGPYVFSTRPSPDILRKKLTGNYQALGGTHASDKLFGIFRIKETITIAEPIRPLDFAVIHSNSETIQTLIELDAPVDKNTLELATKQYATSFVNNLSVLLHAYVGDSIGSTKLFRHIQCCPRYIKISKRQELFDQLEKLGAVRGGVGVTLPPSAPPIPPRRPEPIPTQAELITELARQRARADAAERALRELELGGGGGAGAGTGDGEPQDQYRS
jgi:hypothetical protein